MLQEEKRPTYFLRLHVRITQQFMVASALRASILFRAPAARAFKPRSVYVQRASLRCVAMTGTTQLDKSTPESQWKEKLTDAEVTSCSKCGVAPCLSIFAGPVFLCGQALLFGLSRMHR